MIGMHFKILPTKEFSTDFKKLDSQAQLRIKQKIEDVSKDPTRYKFLHYDLSGSCRVRVGKLRVIFSYNESKKEIYLEKVVINHQYQK